MFGYYSKGTIEKLDNILADQIDKLEQLNYEHEEDMTEDEVYQIDEFIQIMEEMRGVINAD